MMMMTIMTKPTKSDAIWASRLKSEREERENWEDNARNDQIDDIVVRFTSQTDMERHTSVRRDAAVVPRLRFRPGNLCTSYEKEATWRWAKRWRRNDNNNNNNN